MRGTWMTKLDLFTIKGRGWSTPAFLSYPYIVKYIGARAGGGEGGCSPPKFGATQFFWAARENLGKASF